MTMEAAAVAADKTVEYADKGLDASLEYGSKGVDLTKEYGAKAGELTLQGLDTTFKALGAEGAFQSVFSLGGAIDTSDAALEKMFSGSAHAALEARGRSRTERATALTTAPRRSRLSGRRTVDGDGSGKISESEMTEAIKQLYGKALDDSMVKQMMDAADTDKVRSGRGASRIV